MMDDGRKDRFVALDFEILDTWRATVCSVGCVVFENGRPVEKFHSLVCPPSKSENYYCVMTHGLCYADVKDAPSFPSVWETVDKMIGDSPIVAHNAAFEKSCINACSDFFGTNSDYRYIDTLKESRSLLTDISTHTLDSVCDRLGVILEKHHSAIDDAMACGECHIKLLEEQKHG